MASRKPFALILIGIVIGLSAGWFLGQRLRTEKTLIPGAKGTAYTSLSNEELKNRSAQLVAAIRGLTRSFYEKDNQMRMDADSKLGAAKSKSEQESIRKNWLEESAKLHDAFMQRYKDNFWADALLLRNAMVARLGAVPGAKNPLFQYPTNILGVEQVADSLELMSKSLPAKTSALGSGGNGSGMDSRAIL
jgi:hypothetical protein